MKPKRPDKKPTQDLKSRQEAREKAESMLELAWVPKTILGKQVKEKQITNIYDILLNGESILEKEIVDILLPDLDNELLLIGQSKGKFGGGQRRVFRQTQKKTREGNKPKFATMAIVGNRAGVVGIGYGKAKETVPAREKAIRNAKIGVFNILRGCGSWQCGCGTPHSIPFAVTGKCGSVEIKLIPAPKGTGLRVEKEVAKILARSGISDIWSKTKGQTKTKINMIKAAEAALKQLSKIRILEHHKTVLSISNGNSKTEVSE